MVFGCQTCLRVLGDPSLGFDLESVGPGSDAVSLKEKVTDCIPELILDSAENAMICDACVRNLSAAYQFKQSCLTTQQKVYDFLQQVPDDSPKDMGNIALHYHRLKVVAQGGDITLDDINTENQKPIYNCRKCNFSCLDKCVLKLHDVLHNNQTPPFQCDRCPFIYPTTALLLDHLASHYSENPYMCTLCDFVASSNSQLKAHGWSHRQPFQCDICWKRFDTKYELGLHMDVHEDEHNAKRFQCGWCEYKCDFVEMLEFHSQTNHQTVFKCNECTVECRTLIGLTQHMERIHRVSISAPEDINFSTISYSKDNGIEPRSCVFSCEKCLVECKSWDELKEHFKHCLDSSQNLNEVASPLPEVNPTNVEDDSLKNINNSDIFSVDAEDDRKSRPKTVARGIKRPWDSDLDTEICENKIGDDCNDIHKRRQGGNGKAVVEINTLDQVSAISRTNTAIKVVKNKNVSVPRPGRCVFCGTLFKSQGRLRKHKKECHAEQIVTVNPIINIAKDSNNKQDILPNDVEQDLGIIGDINDVRLPIQNPDLNTVQLYKTNDPLQLIWESNFKQCCKCPICTLDFESKTALKKHWTSMHSSESVKGWRDMNTNARKSNIHNGNQDKKLLINYVGKSTNSQIPARKNDIQCRICRRDTCTCLRNSRKNLEKTGFRKNNESRTWKKDTYLDNSRIKVDKADFRKNVKNLTWRKDTCSENSRQKVDKADFRKNVENQTGNKDVCSDNSRKNDTCSDISRPNVQKADFKKNVENQTWKKDACLDNSRKKDTCTDNSRKNNTCSDNSRQNIEKADLKKKVENQTWKNDTCSENSRIKEEKAETWKKDACLDNSRKKDTCSDNSWIKVEKADCMKNVENQTWKKDIKLNLKTHTESTSADGNTGGQLDTNNSAEVNIQVVTSDFDIVIVNKLRQNGSEKPATAPKDQQTLKPTFKDITKIKQEKAV